MVGGQQQGDVGMRVQQRGYGVVQDGYVALGLRLVRGVGVHGEVGGGYVHDVGGFQRHGVGGGADGPAVDVQRVDGRRLAGAFNRPRRRALGRYGAVGALGQQGSELVLGGGQDCPRARFLRALEEGLGEYVLAGFHVYLLPRLAYQAVVGAYAVNVRVLSGYDGDVVDVGYGRHHALAHAVESALGDFGEGWGVASLMYSGSRPSTVMITVVDGMGALQSVGVGRF